jgi:hypothetical protein
LEYRLVSAARNSLQLGAAAKPVRCSHFQLAAAGRSRSGRTFNPKVAGSIPARPIRNSLDIVILLAPAGVRPANAGQPPRRQHLGERRWPACSARHSLALPRDDRARKPRRTRHVRATRPGMPGTPWRRRAPARSSPIPPVTASSSSPSDLRSERRGRADPGGRPPGRAPLRALGRRLSRRIHRLSTRAGVVTPTFIPPTRARWLGSRPRLGAPPLACRRWPALEGGALYSTPVAVRARLRPLPVARPRGAGSVTPGAAVRVRHSLLRWRVERDGPRRADRPAYSPSARGAETDRRGTLQRHRSSVRRARAPKTFSTSWAI